METLYRTLVSMWIHQDQLSWSRVQLFIAVQGGVIAGMYYVSAEQKILLVLFILGLGIILTLIIHQLAAKDAKDRDVNLHIIDAIGKTILPQTIINILEKQEKRTCIRLTSGSKSDPFYNKGKCLLQLAMIIFIAVDVVLALICCFKPELIHALPPSNSSK